MSLYNLTINSLAYSVSIIQALCKGSKLNMFDRKSISITKV